MIELCLVWGKCGFSFGVESYKVKEEICFVDMVYKSELEDYFWSLVFVGVLKNV